MGNDTPEILQVRRSKQQAQVSYDRMSRWYDYLSGPAEARFRRAGLQLLAVQPGERVLEIGCGTGACLPHLIEAAAPAKVTALDLSTGMLAEANHRLVKAELSTRAFLTCSDAATLPFRSGYFHAVFISFTLELFDTPEIPLVLAECWRVLVSGGRLGVVSMNLVPRRTLMTRLYEWAHKHLEPYADCRPIPLAHYLEKNGFQPKRIRRMSMFGLPVAAAAAVRASLMPGKRVEIPV